jgi:hypothetical protein
LPKPYYILSVHPTKYCKIKDIFSSQNNSIVKKFQNPGGIRSMGWDLVTNDFPRLEQGEYWEVGGGRKLIRLYEDGTLILRVLANQDFLGWGQYENYFKINPKINSLALIEITYNFVNFYEMLLPHFDREIEEFKYQCELTNTVLENKKKLYLLPGMVKERYFGDDGKEAPTQIMKIKLIKGKSDLNKKAAYITFEIIRKIYLWFGLTEDVIPYTTIDEDNKKYIDVNSISKIR